jgi:hypothetical protein
MQKEIEVGDYIVYPNHSELEYARVLKIIRNKFSQKTLKLSCRIRSFNTYFYKQRTNSIDDLHEHNSFYYKQSLNYLIINDYVTKGVDITKLKSRKKLHKELQKQLNV